MNLELVKKIEKITAVVIILLIVYVLVINPYIQFKKNENIMLEAAKRYYEINEDKMPTGRRIATLGLETLYNEKYIEKDFYIPLTKKVCSAKNSWAKVKKVDGNPKYYIYLDCGVLKSNVDHEGPIIKLKGQEKMTISRYSTFEDPGVESIIDKNDGKMSIKEVEISGDVNTNENGNYEITYEALDALKNRTTVTRKITVIQKLKDTIKKATKTGYYTGADPDNYIYFSGNLYRIMEVDGENIKIVSNEYVGNVNYQSLDSYLRKYYRSLSPSSKKFVVQSKYCNMNMDDKKTNATKCNSYTDKRDTYIFSITDINKANGTDGNYLIPSNIDWTANKADDKTTYATREFFIGTNSKFLAEENYNIYGVRPVLTIKGDARVASGDGTFENPYRINDTKIANPGELLNTRYSGEYISVNTDSYRIVESKKKEATKVCGTDLLFSDEEFVLATNRSNKGGYNYVPTNKESVAYYINNKATKYLSTSSFVKHKISVPIYKKHIIYGKEVDKKDYTVKFFAPDAFDLYNTHLGQEFDYWLMNSTKTVGLTYIMSETGSIYDNDEYTAIDAHGIKVCGYLEKDATIISGTGTQDDPYIIK